MTPCVSHVHQDKLQYSFLYNCFTYESFISNCWWETEYGQKYVEIKEVLLSN